MEKNKKVTITPENTPKDLNRESFKHALSISKRKISQTKGEVFDVLNERISSELYMIDQLCQSVFSNMEVLGQQNHELNQKVALLEDRISELAKAKLVKLQESALKDLPPQK